MKALMLKDYYTIARQMKKFLILILFFACVPGYSMSSFAIIYASMLPITALAYDERSKWNTLAAMMPYSRSSIVMSKYVLGYISIGMTAIISVIAQIAVNLYKHTNFEVEGIVFIVVVICIALLLQSFTLPFIFRFGVEKGRLAFSALIAVAALGGMAFGKKLAALLKFEKPNIALIGIILIVSAIIINIVSIIISEKIYKVN
ncbi:MAG: ABC-2 transporter permease [Bacillota bacterium]|nr:ABC-2 transporter permease [Bacillota bacterium]